MITKQQLEEIGFKWDESFNYGCLGKTDKLHKKIEEGIDSSTTIIMRTNYRFVDIELIIVNDFGGVTTDSAFRGKCESIEFLKEILNAVV